MYPHSGAYITQNDGIICLSAQGCGSCVLPRMCVLYTYAAPPPQVNCLEPHPFSPVLAVSGLDHDPKIFSPTSKDRTLKEDVKDVRKGLCPCAVCVPVCVCVSVCLSVCVSVCVFISVSVCMQGSKC